MKYWNRRLGVKIACFILTVPLLAVILLSIAGVAYMWDQELYYQDEYEVIEDAVYSQFVSDSYFLMQDIWYQLDREQPLSIPSRYTNPNYTNLRFALLDMQGNLLYSTLSESSTGMETTFYYTLERHAYAEGRYHIYPSLLNGDAQDIDQLAEYQIRCYLDTELAVKDSYYWQILLVGFAYDMRTAVYYVVAIALILLIFCFVNLTATAGRRPGTQELHPGKMDKVPTDVLLIAALAIWGTGYPIWQELSWSISDTFAMILLWAGIVAAAYGLLGLWMCLAARFKRRQLVKNTLVWRVCSLLWRCLKGLKNLIVQLPMIWRTGLVAGGILLWNFLILFEILIRFSAISYRANLALIMILTEAVVLSLGLLWLALKLRKLQAAGQALADGNLSHQLDTSDLIGDFKAHGENLNSIAQGMTKAVEERMRSERMKTELITNVSHDIKNPLTSIINYSDLIAQSPCENPEHQEYAQVLSRKSQHLKRLLEDLVEVSKAASGNLEVDMAPCQAGVLLQQLSGEFEERCRQADLTLVVRQPEEALRIQVDSRRIWRVFENLMGNACKYSLPGSRVYLSLEKRGDTAVFTFRNTSREPLDISPEELLERFVRGDSARSTEGNGLGLSIAQSLTALQGGEMNLGIDGDLFKVTLTFPLEK